MGRKQMPPMDMPKHWVFRLSNALTLPMQQHLWSAYTDLVSVAVPDTCPPASKTWTLTLGRRVFASDEAGSSSQDTGAGTREANVTPGTLQHRASSPAARGAALRFMAMLDLLLGGAGEGRGRIESGPLTPPHRTPSPAPAWGGWGGYAYLFGSPRDMCAHVDFSALHTARIMQCVPGADGKRELDPAEIDAAADAVRARCGVSPDVDIMPFRLGGLGTCVTIEVGSDDSWKLPDAYDEGYTFYINLRPPNQGGTVEFHMMQLNMTVPLVAGDLLAFRSAVQVHAIKDGPEDSVSKSKKKKNKKKKKKHAAAGTSAGAGAVAGAADGDEAEMDDDDSDIDEITSGISGTNLAGPSSAAGPSAAGSSKVTAPSSSAHREPPARASLNGTTSSSTAGPSAATASSSSAAGSSSAGWASSSRPSGSSAAAGGSGSRSGSGSAAGPSSASSGSAAPTTTATARSTTTMARSTPHPNASINFSAMPRVMITVWTDIETVANVAMAAKMVWPDIKIGGSGRRGGELGQQYY